jgi:hypothetical protein
MVQVNGNYLKLKAGYLFPEIGRRVKAFSEAHPTAPIIRLGIGDVTEPLPEACRQAMQAAIDELGTREGFHGYGPEQGYLWLRQAIAEHDFQARGAQVSAEEIFVSDGSKCDSANILDILGEGNRIAVTDPVYPVYVDSNVMAGRTGDADELGRYAGLTYLPISAENGFCAQIPSEKVDLIYLCFPNNPTGAVASKAQLQQWVDYALANDALILFDAAYEAFIQDPELPHSIYEGEAVRDRIPLLLQERRLHRHPLRPHRGAPRPDGQGRQWRSGGTVGPVEPAPVHQVQRRELLGAARRRSGVFRRRPGPGAGSGAFLYGKRGDHSPRTDRRRPGGVWRRTRPLRVGEDPGGP